MDRAKRKDQIETSKGKIGPFLFETLFFNPETVPHYFIVLSRGNSVGGGLEQRGVAAVLPVI